MILVNLIQYKRIVGMFNNHYIASNSLNYSYLCKNCHNYDLFTLVIELIILTFCHLNVALSNWIFVPPFFPSLISTFSRKILYLSMTGVYVHHMWLCLTIIRLSSDIEQNPSPKRTSSQTFFSLLMEFYSIPEHNFTP